MSTLEDLRDEYKRDGIGVLLCELLQKIVWATVRQYPASEYSPYNIWDKMACEDVLNDWIAERLWGRADLQLMLASAINIQQLRASLTTSLRQHLTNKRRRSIASNLYKRIRAVLKGDPSYGAINSGAIGSEQVWGLADHNPLILSQISVDELFERAFELSDADLEVVRYGPFSEKLSPILRDSKIRLFLNHLFVRARGGLTLSTIIEVMRYRFSLPIEEHTEVDENIPSSIPSPEDQATVSIKARSVVSRIGTEEYQIMTAYFASDCRIAEVGDFCECTSKRVHEVVHGVFGMICECAESQDEARAIMESVESLLIHLGE